MDTNTFFSRYGSYLAIVAAIAALVVLAPGDDGGTDVSAGVGSGAISQDFTAQPGVAGTIPTAVQPGEQSLAPTQQPQAGGPVVTTPRAPGQPPATARPGGGATPAQPVAPGQPSGPAAPGNPLDNPECDPATGRIRVPTLFAPPCVPVHTGSNGGETYMGVTDTTIKVVYFQAESDPAVDAALTAAGANNTRDEQRATMLAYVDYFNHHYETYGRTVEIVIREGSGDSADDAVGRADALAIAKEDKPFAVFGSPGAQSFVEELAANKILCVCTTSQPQEFYERLAPYIGYTTLMSSTQGYVHRAEYVGKRLAGRNADHAGTRDGVPMNVEPRSFGLLWYETPDNSYAAGIEFFVKHLKEVYGVTLTESLSHPSDYSQVAERARPLIQRMKSSGVTSIIYAGDPISPALFTQEATRQLYFPEWIITGSALTDTNIFARTFDQEQWSRAFGVSFLSIRSPEPTGTAYRTHFWHHGTTAVANNQYGVIYPTPAVFFTGVHLAGPHLTVETWQAGLFSYPLTGRGLKTAASSSFGNHGIWPFIDYTNLDDVTEIWWDPNAIGEDEVGNEGKGMYRYVDGGTRYLPGEHPTTDPVVFTDVESAPTGYDVPPPGEEHPDYEHQPH